MSKHRKVLHESVNVTSTNRGFGTVQHTVATYEQTKKHCPILAQMNCRRWNTYKTLKVVNDNSKTLLPFETPN